MKEMKDFRQKFEENPPHSMVIQTLLNLKVNLKTLTNRVRNLYSWLSTSPLLGEVLNPTSDSHPEKSKKPGGNSRGLNDPDSKILLKHLA